MFNRTIVNQSFADDILYQLNNSLLHITIPTMCFTGVCIVVGMIGNALTVFIYRFKFVKSSSHILVTWLAILDVISCAFVMPFDLYVFRFPIMFKNIAACKIFRFIGHFANTAAPITLMCIAFDRYFKLCKPASNFGIMKAKMCIFITLLSASILSWPALVLFNIETVDTTIADVYGSGCRLSKSAYSRIYAVPYYAGLTGISLVVFSMLIALYLRIGYSVIHWRRNRVGFQQNSTKMTATAASNISANPNRVEPTSSIFNRSKVFLDVLQETASSSRTDSCFSVEAQSTNITNNACHARSEVIRTRSYNSLPTTGHTKTVGRRWRSLNARILEKRDNSYNGIIAGRNTRHNANSVVNRTVLTFFLVTVAYILSYVPYFIVIFLEDNNNSIMSKQLTIIEHVFIELSNKSYYVNNVINPFIYGALNHKFRTHFINFFKTCK